MYKDSDLIGQYNSIINFINENDDKNIVDFASKSKKEFGELSIQISDWLKCRLKAQKKLPLFYSKNCILSSRSYEQCTPEIISRHRFKNLSGKKALVIGGGLGVDDYFLSQKFEEIISLDPNEKLNVIARFNFTLLGATNIKRICTTAEEFLKANNQHFDYIFIDPDRRIDSKRKAALEELKPNIKEIWHQLLTISNFIEIKLSPMLDSNFLLNAFENQINLKCYSVKNEIKELLLTKTFEKKGELSSIDLQKTNESFEYNCNYKNNLNSTKEDGITNQFLFIPFKVLYKLALEENYASVYDLKLIENKCLFYTSNIKRPEVYGGNWFQILNRPKNLSQLSTFIKLNDLKFVNLSCLKSDYKETEIFKYLKIKEGGSHYVFIGGSRTKPTIIVAIK